MFEDLTAGAARDRAGLRLRRCERETLKEIEDRTQEGKSIGVRAPAAVATSPRSDWATATADTTKPRQRSAPESTFARGDLVEQGKFRVGVVFGTEPGKVVLLCESGTRQLVART